MVYVWFLVLLLQFLVLYFLLSFTLTTSFPLTHPNCHQYESQALLQFKEGFVINNFASANLLSFPKTASWNATTDCCSWDGIQCDDHTDHVIGIDLSSSQLYGTMDANSTLFRLVHLQNLDLSDNDFNYSQIPHTIGELSQLRYLNLSHTTFFGEIPPQLSHLSNLMSLDLGFNFRTSPGGFAVNFLQLKLSTLKSIFHNSTKLEILQLSYVTTLSALPDTLTNLTSLQALFLYNSELHGEFPVGVFHLPNFPTFIRDLSYLEWLMLSNNSITYLPVWLWRKSSLQGLTISHSLLTGEINSSICNLKSLVRLDLSFNSLSGNVPSCIGNFSRYLKVLLLKGNKLSGLIPQTYQMENTLQMIDFSNNNLQGQLPRALVNCGLLEYFDISHNNINDSFPFWLGDLPELKVLALSNNKFHGEITCSSNMTCTFPKLHIIDLSHNEFSGGFPSEMIQRWKAMKVSNTSELQYEQGFVYLRFNKSGEYLKAYNSYSFTLSNKGLVMVYKRLQQFYSMIAIDMSSNKISGEIPKFIGELMGLVLLNLSNNIFIGSIPNSLGKLSNLEALDLSHNSLSGKIPQQLTQLTFLEFFNVSFNNLSGPIPQNKQFSTFQGDSFEGNEGLCGDQLVKKCLDHDVHSFSPPTTSDDDNDSDSFFEIDWKVSVIGYIGGLVAGVALGSTYSSQVLGWLKRVF